MLGYRSLHFGALYWSCVLEASQRAKRGGPSAVIAVCERVFISYLASSFSIFSGADILPQTENLFAGLDGSDSPYEPRGIRRVQGGPLLVEECLGSPRNIF